MSERRQLPLLALRGAVAFPGTTIPIGVGRAASLKAVEEALKGDRTVFAVSEREEVDANSPDKLYSIGVIAHIGEVQRGLGGLQLLLTPQERAAALEYRPSGGMTRVLVRPVAEMKPLNEEDPAFVALYREVRERAIEFGKQRGLSEEVLVQVINAVSGPGEFADLVATHLELPVAEKQALLETLGVEERLRKVLVHLHRRIEQLNAQQRIRESVTEEIGAKQREMYLREQLKAIHKELGEGDQENEVQALREKLEKLDLPEQARAEAQRELSRLERVGAESMEAQVIRNHLQWMAELPWNQRTEDKLDLKLAEQVLEEDHYGLSDVKDRVLEFLSVRELQARQEKASDASTGEKSQAAEKSEKPSRGAKGSILLFVGPPGVGKTSIAKGIARALGRKYVRIALGGVHDEADIRGHRRTYVGAMPGRIVAGLKQAGSKNPVFLLDEVDKLGASFHGDPASALLEVLDPAQNNEFTDHYLNVAFDLSEVLFIATANVAHTIPPALLDRMEVVNFSGYTEREKLEIAKRYIVPRQLEESGLSAHEPKPSFEDAALHALISMYTRESGVRQLERQVGAISRKLARKVASGDGFEPLVGPEQVKKLLGRPKVHPERASEVDESGAATGMYYTPAGGDIMFVEAAVRKLYSRARPESTVEAEGWGDVALILTGQLGDVMKESARAALTYAATHARELEIPPQSLGSIEAHIHVPAGAIPKDGPSAGVTIATALVSAMTGRRVRKDVAMTGEITLRGRVLPIGGVKEKVLGAHRAGIRHIILPKQNEADLEDVPSEVQRELEFHFAETLSDVLRVALADAPAGVQPPSSRKEGTEGAASEQAGPTPWMSQG
ncbi:MAG: endopeptidase La [Myxococcota bacterium]